METRGARQDCLSDAGETDLGEAQVLPALKLGLVLYLHAALRV